MAKKPQQERVHWVDARSHDGWDRLDKRKAKVSQIETLGHIAKETNKVLCIASSWDATTGCFGGAMSIPKIAITRREKI